MELHADLHQRAVVHAAHTPWVASPMAGVERRMLHRVGHEVAQATSIVRYAPGSRFSAHTHTGGEEFLVLDGVFQDEHGDYPAGSYVRNPPGSSHTPSSVEGATIFVKLWQFDPQDRTPVRWRGKPLARVADASRPGVEVSPLFQDKNEDVRVEWWAANSRMELDLPGGGELLLIDGGFTEGGERFAPHSWLRVPCGARLQADVGAHGAKVWVKLGHLAFQASLDLPV
jgi:quercetin dioxygenase-like cupin family protein